MTIIPNKWYSLLRGHDNLHVQTKNTFSVIVVVSERFANVRGFELICIVFS